MATSSLGQIAYDAFGEHQAWLNYAGQQMPSWPSVRPDIKTAWEVSARAVIRAVQQAHNTGTEESSVPVSEEVSSTEPSTT